VSFLLDTNILSEHLRRPSGLIHRFVQHSGRLYTSSISLSELYVWVFGRPDSPRVRSAVEKMLTYEVSSLPLDSDCAEEFGRLRVGLRRKGLNVDNMDLLIAATALVYDLTLVTHNTAHFRNIPSLRLEDWIAS
jgi:predicted nucleic acid-binding protein